MWEKDEKDENVPHSTRQTEGESQQDVSKIVAVSCDAPAEAEMDEICDCIASKTYLSSQREGSVNKSANLFTPIWEKQEITYQKPDIRSRPPIVFAGWPQIKTLESCLNMCFCLFAPLKTVNLLQNIPMCKLEKFNENSNSLQFPPAKSTAVVPFVRSRDNIDWTIK